QFLTSSGRMRDSKNSVPSNGEPATAGATALSSIPTTRAEPLEGQRRPVPKVRVAGLWKRESTRRVPEGFHQGAGKQPDRLIGGNQAGRLIISTGETTHHRRNRDLDTTTSF